MTSPQTPLPRLTLVRPDPDRDAPFALGWFQSDYGKDTLLRMGNPAHKITAPTLEGETRTIREFLELEKSGQQLTWAIRYDNKTIGAVWLELVATPHLRAPAFHIMIGDPSYRGKGIGKIVMREMIRYARDVLKAKTLYSRHLTSNTAITHLNQSVGFVKDGTPYTDEDGLEFQNIKLDLDKRVV